MKQPEAKDPIDAVLREQDWHIDDAGFTSRVVVALPRRRRAWLRPVLLLGATVVGTVLAIRWLPWGNLPPLDSSAVLSLNSQVLLPWALVVAVAVSLAWAVVGAVQWED